MLKKTFLLITFAFLFSAAYSQDAGKKQPVDYVDPVMGTIDSRWMLFPGASRPFGMVKLSPDNQRRGWKAGYEYNINNIAGFSHIHSWTMGGLLTMPTVGDLKIKPGKEDEPDIGYRSRFSHENEHAKPGYYSVFLDDYGIKAEITSTIRAGFQRYTFPESDDARILIDLKIPTEYKYEIFGGKITKVSDKEIQGFVNQQSLRKANYNEYTIYFVIRFDKPFESFNGWIREDIKRDTNKVHLLFGHEDLGAFVNFSTEEGKSIQMQSGVSLVSVKQARLNLETEMNGFKWDFDKAVKDSQKEWNDLLGTIKVEGGSESDKKKFYTNMYRAYSSRTTWSDVNGKYRDMYEKVQQADNPESPVYGCDAFWNTFWNLNQLWTLQHPEVANKWVNSLLEIYDKGGWLPKGPTGIEYSSIMVASHEIPLIVSAYQKGIRNYDVEKAWEAMLHNQMTPGTCHMGGGLVGNRHLEAYMKYGFVPDDAGPVSNTMEYAYDDYTVSQMAKALGREKDYKTFMKRAYNYRNIFKEDEGYVWRKKKDSSWVENFSKTGHSTFLGSGFVEGNAWQYTWFVPHDQSGLVEMLGQDEFINRLTDGFEKSSKHRFNSEHMHKNGLLGMGVLPINHGNQPNMQAAYLFNHAGAPWLTQKWVREIMNGFYYDGPDAWPGDEDQGQMGAWYVMSAMGLFEMDGGTSVKPVYEIGSPVFDKITIELDEKYYPGGEFVIETKNNSDKNRYIQKATLDGKPLNKPWFYHDELADGGKLVVWMDDEPNKAWGRGLENAPPSMSNRLSEKEREEILSYDRRAEEMEAWNKAMNAYYYHKKSHFETLNDRMKDEIIFLGNSITDGAEWDELFGNEKILNRGIGGDDTDGILERLEEITNRKPAKIFLMIGTNDLANGKSVDYIVKNQRKIVERIQKESPETTLFLQSVLPTDDKVHTSRANGDIMDINNHLRQMANEYGLTYIDLFSLFANENNRMKKEYSIDGLHINGKGYQVWKEAIEDYVNQ